MNLTFCRVAIATVLCGALAASQAVAVNLVPNDSFETYTSCPTAFSQIALATPWSDATQGTSDYYNACASGAFTPDVPMNNFGNQAARTGVAYAGIVAWDGNSGYREYMEAPLNAALVANTSYTVSFYVSLSDNSDTAIDRLGAYLSVGPVGPVGTTMELSFTPQVESPANGFLTDKTTWMLVSGTLTAEQSVRGDAASGVHGPGRNTRRVPKMRFRDMRTPAREAEDMGLGEDPLSVVSTSAINLSRSC